MFGVQEVSKQIKYGIGIGVGLEPSIGSYRLPHLCRSCKCRLVQLQALQIECFNIIMQFCVVQTLSVKNLLLCSSCCCCWTVFTGAPSCRSVKECKTFCKANLKPEKKQNEIHVYKPACELVCLYRGFP